MKHKLLLHILPSDRWTVAERYALDIMLHFRNAGYETVALTREVMTIDRRLQRLGFPIIHSPLRGPYDLATLTSVIKALGHRPAGRSIIVHTHRINDAMAAVVARKFLPRRDIKVILTHHQPDRVPTNALSSRIFRRIDVHLAAARECAAESLHDIISILPYSVNTEALSTPPMPVSGPICMAYKGELARGNGLELLIDALKLTLPLKPRLIIAGNGNPDYLDRLRRRAQLRGVMERIDWMRDSDDPFAPVAAAHFGVFPSVSPRNAIDMLDFMAAGRTYISELRGASPQTIANNIRAIASDRTTPARLGEEARQQFLNSHSWDNFISQLSDIYTSPRQSDRL